MYHGGYTGKILRINLTEKTYGVEALPLETAIQFIGGAGTAIKVLFDELRPKTDPLGPENKLIFSAGPFTGTSVPCASRMAVATKSPLTHAAGMALSGGYFPAEMKFAGYDMIIIEGRAQTPTYLWIRNNEVCFKRADKTWGAQTGDCQQMIKNELNDQNVRIACIGPAGENLSKMAAIINERRAFGRKGVGAVMGSKNLKALVLRGQGELKIASQEKLKKARGAMAKAMKESHVLYPAFAKSGTPMVVDHLCRMGIFPGKNFSATGEFDPSEKIGLAGQSPLTVGKEHCYNCPVGCTQLKLAQSGAYAGTLGEPEFETLFALGGQTGVENPDAIVAADRLCDELGIDTISAGVAVGFAMELFEKGILTEHDTGGMSLKFGDHKTMVKLIHMMAHREGLGGLLADGVKIAAEKIGKNAQHYAMHVKGLELPGYDVRGAKAHGLNYATAYTGADHCRGYAFQEIFSIPVPEEIDRFAVKGKGKLTVWNQDMRTATTDCPTMCGFILDMALPGTALANTADLMAAVTGLAYTPEEVLRVGERVSNLAKAFNLREGFTRQDDTLPERLMKEALRAGESKGQRISQTDLDLMLDEYYTERGWDPQSGIPTRAKLESLALGYVADQLNL
ncbi:MAG: aldehyde ferredoxin oxidoreductase family protein [Desulfobacterales bacterium]